MSRCSNRIEKGTKVGTNLAYCGCSEMMKESFGTTFYAIIVTKGNFMSKEALGDWPI